MATHRALALASLEDLAWIDHGGFSPCWDGLLLARLVRAWVDCWRPGALPRREPDDVDSREGGVNGANYSIRESFSYPRALEKQTNSR